MNEEENKIKGGVIIMGSLFWENEKNCVKGKGAEGKARRDWRDSNLELSETKSVRIPTRYGRFSGEKNRKQTYTMVLSREYLEKLGTALVVPFKRLFSLKDELKSQLTDQLVKLSKVEGIYESPDNLLAKDWSALSIWINLNSIYYEEIKTYWQVDIIRNPNNGYISSKNYEWSDGSLLDNNFQLQLPINSDFDFLLCTYMLPRYEGNDKDSDRQQNLSKGYPTPEMIGNAIKKSGYSTYFCENRVSGIVTADDDEIFKHISKTY